MKELIVLASVLVVALSSAVQSPAPAFCNNLQCPKFTTVQSNANYELRNYEQSVWVSTNVTAMEFTNVTQNEMFYRLFHYISGNNTSGGKIEMTCPVLVKVEHGPGPTCESFFEYHFMVPFEFQANPPAPTDPKVYFTTLPPFNVYVTSYGGRPQFDDKMRHLENLAQELSAKGVQFTETAYYFAGYDGPYKILNRHNEAWLMAKN